MRALTLTFSLLLTGCELLEDPGLGGYAMSELAVREVRLSGDLGPAQALDDDVDSASGVSCPGELYLTFSQRQAGKDIDLEIAFNEAIPEMEAGEVFRVQSTGEDHLALYGTVTDDEGTWTGTSEQAELIVTYLGLNVYQMAFAGVVVGDEDAAPSTVSGSFRMSNTL